ncbi:MAG: hypothetical protein ACJ72H_25455 [Candidatus Sulfotelmatobacter sp.]
MATADMSTAVEQPQGEAFYRPSTPGHERARFTPEQQEAFDRAFRKRERKLRGEYEAMRTDFFETIQITQQLLERCKDRISCEDECAIRDGLQAMRKDYKWQKQVK